MKAVLPTDGIPENTNNLLRKQIPYLCNLLATQRSNNTLSVPAT